MQKVMDMVQIQQLLLLLQADHMEMGERLGGARALEDETLAEDQGEVHDFEGNLDH